MSAQKVVLPVSQVARHPRDRVFQFAGVLFPVLKVMRHLAGRVRHLRFREHHFAGRVRHLPKLRHHLFSREQHFSRQVYPPLCGVRHFFYQERHLALVMRHFSKVQPQMPLKTRHLDSHAHESHALGRWHEMGRPECPLGQSQLCARTGRSRLCPTFIPCPPTPKKEQTYAS